MGSVARTALRPSKHVSPIPEPANRKLFDFRDRTRYADSQSKSTIVNIAPAKETREHDDWFGDEADNKRYG